MYPLNQPYIAYPISFTTAIAGSVIAGPYDCSPYRSLTLHITAIGDGDFAMQGSIDGTNYIAMPITRLDSITSGFTGTSAGQTGSFYINTLNFKFIRAIANVAFTTGTTTASIALSSTLLTPALNFSVPYVNAASGSKMQTLISTAAVPATTGGSAVNYEPSIASPGINYYVVKAGQGTITSLNVSNSSATDAWVKITNATSVTFAGNASNTKAKLNILVKAGTSYALNVGYAGMQFGAGIVIWVAGGSGLLDASTAPAGVLVNIGWQ